MVIKINYIDNMPKFDTESRKKIFTDFIEYINPEDRELIERIFEESLVFHNPEEEDLEIENLTTEDAKKLHRYTIMSQGTFALIFRDKEITKLAKELITYIKWRLKQPLTDTI